MTYHVKALQTAQQNEPSQSSTDSTRNTTKGLTKLWLMGVAAWGHRWTSSLGELPVESDGSITMAGRLWAQQLTGIPQSEVLKALAGLAGQSDWPPTLAELRAACKDQAAEQVRNNPPRQESNHRMYNGKISARSASNESVEENCKAFNDRCKEYGYEITDHNY